jgi:hypothetical protein
VYRDLSASDAELLAEFYGAVSEVADLIKALGGDYGVDRVQCLERLDAQGAEQPPNGRVGGTETLS